MTIGIIWFIRAKVQGHSYLVRFYTLPGQEPNKKRSARVNVLQKRLLFYFAVMGEKMS